MSCAAQGLANVPIQKTPRDSTYPAYQAQDHKSLH